MNRREFLKTGGAIAAAAISGCKSADTPAEGTNMKANPQKTALKFPRYRGFNFPVGFGSKGPRRRKFNEEDFEIIKGWGFDFGRIPMSYWNWASKDDWYNIDDSVLKEIDGVVEKGKQYKIHINLNLHRIPGYCINGRDQEPMDLYEDTPERMQKALDAAVFHWKMFAKRYKGIPSTQLSFDLINESPTLKEETRHVEVVTALVKGIREEDPNRLIVADDKPIALGEVGAPPPPEKLREQPRWARFMVWGNLQWGANREAYDCNETLTWEKLPWVKDKKPKIHYPILK